MPGPHASQEVEEIEFWYVPDGQISQDDWPELRREGEAKRSEASRAKRSEAKRAKIGDATSEASRAKIGNATSEAKRSEAKRSEAKIGVS